MSSQAPAPGWYADPTGQSPHRWWDGQQWTEHVAQPAETAQPAQPQYVRQQAASAAGPQLFESRTLVVSQKAKLVELTNEYDVNDVNGMLLGRVVEVGQSGLKKAVRFLGNYDQFFTHTLELRDPSGAVLLTMTRPAKITKSRMQIAQGNGTPIGEIVQENFFGKKRFGFSVGGAIIGGIRAENWRSWDFAIEDANGTEIGRINKKWAGVGRELFTTADHYQVVIHHDLPYPLRLMVIASAVTVDTSLKQDE